MIETNIHPDGLSWDQIQKYLRDRLIEIPDWLGDGGIYRLGFPMTEPHPVGLHALSMFLPANTNNIGIHMNAGTELTGTRRIEVDVLNQLGSLFHGTDLTGYITTGGTESNLYGLWAGRNALRAQGHSKVVVLTSEVAHSGLRKAADILDLPFEKIQLSEHYTLSPPQVVSRITDLVRSGYTGFIVVSTAGHCITGMVDPVSAIAARLETLCEQSPDISVYHHVDAAYGGFVLPFSNPGEVFDFRNPFVHSLSADAHKMGLLPYSCGVVFCRRPFAEEVTFYAEETDLVDGTIIGSRPGSTAAALWAVVNSLGVSGYSSVVQSAIRKRNLISQGIRAVDPNAIILQRPDNNVLAVSFSSEQRLPHETELRFRLSAYPLPVFSKRGKPTYAPFYHIYAMPSLPEVGIHDFLQQIRAVIQEGALVV